MQELEIGYCPLRMDWKAGEISITPKPNVDRIVADVESDPGIHGNWVYAPEQETLDIMSGGVAEMPYKSRVFGLPKTHTMSHSGAMNEEHLRFLIWCLGFFTGMRLTADEAGFLDATPIKPGVLHDIVWSDADESRALEYADEYWHRHSSEPRISKGLTGVIHSFFLSQTPTLLEFERFIYLYVALDGCYRICESMFPGKFPKKSGPVPHGLRIPELCHYFSMSGLSQSVKDIVSCRNDTLHEGLFFGEPLGFQLYGGVHHRFQGGTLLEMTKLVSRLIVAILVGLPAAGYFQSRVDDRQRHGVRL